MRIPLRIIAPICLAFVCASALVVFLWWQLNTSTHIIHTAITEQTTQNGAVAPVQPQTSFEHINPEDRALMHLRQGDLQALQTDWQGAQKQYELSVRHGGGVPALRKLAQAQLQRRDTNGVYATIRKLKAEGAKAEDILLLESITYLRSGELVRARNVLQNAKESPHKQYGMALLSIVEGAHDIAKEQLQLVSNGWEPVLRSHAKTLLAAYDEFALFPESPAIHLTTLLSRSLAQVQECELALPMLVQVTQQKSDYRDAWIVQGFCEMSTERADQAVMSLEQAYTIDPQKPEIQYFLGRTYAMLEDHNNALTFLQYALANGFQPQSEVREHIAKEALAIGNGEAALEQYTALIDDLKAEISAYEGYVITAIALDKDQEAYDTAQKAKKRWPESAKALELSGISAVELGKNDEAKADLEKAIELDPFLEKAKKTLEKIT